MKNDLRHCKVEDKIWTIQDGWIKIKSIAPNASYQIKTDTESYTFEGKYNQYDDYPSAFIEPPEGFDVKPEFVKGQKVLVGEHIDTMRIKRYFSHINDNGMYMCFADGCDEWTSNGRTTLWEYCKAWEEK